jgi:hypothetical protein
VNALANNHGGRPGSHHNNGTKSDLHLQESLTEYIEKNWIKLPDRGGDYGGPQYYSGSDLSMVCVNETGRNHWDCCHNYGATTCK